MTFSSPLHTVQIIDIERKTSTTFLAHFLFFLAVAINSTNDTNKAGGAIKAYLQEGLILH